MISHRLLAAAIATCLGSSFASAAGEGWSQDFAAARKQAAAENKDLLVDFTGSDWCGWCIKLNDEVFKHDAFKSGVKDKFVLVEIDSPQDKSKLGKETLAQNEELKEKYAIEGFPTLLLCDASGKPFAKTGYQEGGPEKYVAHLDELRARKQTRDKSFAEAAKAKGPAKAKALVAALDAMELEDAALAAFYPEVIEAIKAADPKDATGFVKRQESQKKLADFENGLNDFGAKQDFEGALAYVTKAAAEGGFEGEDLLQVLATKAMILARMEKFDDAIQAIAEAKAAAPDSETAAQLDSFRMQLEEAGKQGAEEPSEAPKSAE
ncbi:MAG: thioredoxin family protein [Verrucomicrobia bacterium]|nr:MAG: thioredoxin family protein [Verrucomicrobiota bacterium]TAE88338.1 MAG: thioredoxin family protein [Verrucomicrobiota bacterium]TAF26792.1 MAG: thioredoxin family protein [Verrucomicrobiota bacterium]TAF42049.1 MAG: thioredoxin family protein [Verrucomicrobiota bacterium]